MSPYQNFHTTLKKMFSHNTVLQKYIVQLCLRGLNLKIANCLKSSKISLKHINL